MFPTLILAIGFSNPPIYWRMQFQPLGMMPVTGIRQADPLVRFPDRGPEVAALEARIKQLHIQIIEADIQAAEKRAEQLRKATGLTTAECIENEKRLNKLDAEVTKLKADLEAAKKK